MRVRSLVLVAAIGLLLAVSLGAAPSPEGSAAEDVTEVSWLIRFDDTYAIQEIEARFPIDIVAVGVGTNDTEKAQLLLASGEAPDVGHFPAPPGGGKALFEEGVTRTIPISMIREHMPNYTRIMQDYPLGWVLDKAPDSEEMYNLHGLGGHNDGIIYFASTRSDWAENVGMPIPDYDQHKLPLDAVGRNYFYNNGLTIEWLESLLERYRDGDPDGNGKIDTVPWGAGNHIGRSWMPIMNAYGVDDRGPNEVDGQTVHFHIAPGMRDFLVTANRWYSKNLIDKEFISLSTSKAWEKVQKGIIGAAESQISYAGQGYAANRPPNTFVPDAELGTGAESVVFAPLIGPNGYRGGWVKAGLGTVFQYKLHVNANVSDEKLALIMQVLDWARYGDEEQWMMWQYGKPGVHFDWQGEAWNSAPIARDEDAIPADEPTVGRFSNWTYPTRWEPSLLKYYFPEGLADVMLDVIYSPEWDPMEIRPHRADFFSETEFTDKWRRNGDTLDTMFNEFFYKSITGEIDPAAEWDAYVQRWLRAGGAEINAEYMKMPLVSEMFKGNVVY